MVEIQTDVKGREGEREMNKVDLLTLVGGRTEKEGKWANDNENKENKVSQ